ncbi:gephyrin-like molybdotransferase Glp [Aquisalimonas asiatica]|uniref:Molybdopterin molybdenumtransferase n=1 Tax=Aquisalimonas asiatica TaxID=406100 RepID=A0A1H8PWD4_9GAMM|nr:gephyrin-like molybdotransferase Glp [Aquisalimonas asiatica]SEO45984.1 molybdopterin molybdochelatase [Aquisalimonas asiatica]
MNDCTVSQQHLHEPAEALRHMLDGIAPSNRDDVVPLCQALGRVLARDVVARVTTPPHDNAAMDGYACRAADVPEEGGTLPVAGIAAAGDAPATLPEGSAMRIYTGAAVPRGADTVVMQERCSRSGDTVTFSARPERGSHIRLAGEDLNAGDPIIAGGTRLQPQHMALAATAGYGALPVRPRLRVAVLVTGNELAEPGTDARPGQIYNSNGYALLGLLQSLGCDVLHPQIVPDDLEATVSMFREAASEADFVITSGGVSVGDADYVKAAVERIGQLDLWRVAIKPGKPVAFGSIGQTPFLGLPGNPVSLFVTFCLFGRPMILKRQGAADYLPRTINAEAGFSVQQADKRTRYLRARLSQDGRQQRVSLFPDQGSGIISSTTWANALAEIPPHRTIHAGDTVTVHPYSELLT